jgi:hypothetical protein
VKAAQFGVETSKTMLKQEMLGNKSSEIDQTGKKQLWKSQNRGD